MSKKTNFISLIQLITYTGFKDFLTQYHKEVKEQTGQYIGISKALNIATNVISGYKNHHEFTHCLEKVEENKKIFTTRKNIITVNIIEYINEENVDVVTETFNSWESATSSLRSEFYSLAVREDISEESLLEYFSNYYDQEDTQDFESVLDFLNDIDKNKLIDIYDFSSAIEEISHREKQISIKENFVDIEITTGDIHEAVYKKDFENGK